MLLENKMNLMVINNRDLYLHRTLHLPFPQNILFDLSNGHVKKKIHEIYTRISVDLVLAVRRQGPWESQGYDECSTQVLATYPMYLGSLFVVSLPRYVPSIQWDISLFV